MKIAITGASGLVGTALIKRLTAEGHEVLRLVRHEPKGPGEVRWDPKKGEIDTAKLAGIDAAINLAGENVGEGRWTDEKKKAIVDSRVKGTRVLVSALAQLDPKPRVLISASATGFYSDRGDEILTEDSPRGSGFLSDVCVAWEAEAKPAADAGTRLVTPRIGAVLTNEGGAFPKLVMPFRLFAGGKIGSGKQWLSWIMMEDLVQLIVNALGDERYSGPINAVSPDPVTNEEFAKKLGHKMSRPSFFTVPEFAVILALGEMGKETALASTRVIPARLAGLGFKFGYPTLESALDRLLKK